MIRRAAVVLITCFQLVLLWQQRSFCSAFASHPRTDIRSTTTHRSGLHPAFPSRKDDRLRKQDVSRIIRANQLQLQLLPLNDNHPNAPTMTPTKTSLTASIITCSIPIIMGFCFLTMKPDVSLAAVDFSYLETPNPIIPNVDPRYFIAGGICAATSHGVTTPLDVVKTKIQSEPDRFQDQSLLNAAASIVRQDGPQTLLNGLVPTIVGYGFEGALKFGLYESLKPIFVSWLSLSDPTQGYLLASIAAGAVASVVLCPMEQTRIRLVTDPDFADGFVSGIVRLTSEEGAGAILFGLPAMLSKQVPYTVAKQVSFDVFAGLLYGVALQYSLVAADVGTQVAFGSAFLASILACVFSHPGDVILTSTYKGGSSKDGFIGTVNTLYNQKGFPAFFTGIMARFVHVGAIITSQLILYDIIKQMLGLPATGTH